MAKDRAKELERKKRYREKLKAEGGARLEKVRETARKSYHVCKKRREEDPRTDRLSKRKRQVYLKNYRLRVKLSQETAPVPVQAPAPAAAPAPKLIPTLTPTANPAPTNNKSVAAKIREQKKRRNKSRRVSMENKKLKIKLKSLQRKLRRLSNEFPSSNDLNKQTLDSPTKKAKNIMANSKRNLTNLRLHIMLMNSIKQKYGLRRKIAPILKKAAKNYSGVKSEIRRISRIDGRTIKKATESINRRKSPFFESAIQFLDRDDNTREAAGKKECISINGKKVQKRYLLFPMHTLYEKFLSENPSVQISRSTFYKCKPKHVVHPRLQDRQLCLCEKCSNTQLYIDSLYNYKVIPTRDIRNVLTNTVCSVTSFRCCNNDSEDCKRKIKSFYISENILPSVIPYSQWDRVTNENGFTQTKRVEKRASIVGVISKFENAIYEYAKHQYAFCTMFKEMRLAKLNLKEREICLHIDFSENYLMKFGNEVQSAHFGANDQVIIHQGIAYSSDSTAVSFATISKDRRKTSPAVIAHIKKALEILKINELSKILVFSDSPSSQYRNSNTMSFMANLCKQLNIPEFQWFFSEAGHGKSAADGVGAVLKRRADARVSSGEFVDSISSFKSAVADINILVEEVLTEEIEKHLNFDTVAKMPGK